MNDINQLHPGTKDLEKTLLQIFYKVQNQLTYDSAKTAILKSLAPKRTCVLRLALGDLAPV